jgi:hypothetical protein
MNYPYPARFKQEMDKQLFMTELEILLFNMMLIIIGHLKTKENMWRIKYVEDIKDKLA